MQHLLCYSQ